MKNLIKRVFNVPTITDVVIPADKLTVMLNEPVPTAADVLAWHNKNIPANQF